MASAILISPVADKDLDKDTRRFLRLLGEEGRHAVKQEGRLAVIGKQAGVSLRVGSAPFAAAKALLEYSLAAWEGKRGHRELRLTPRGLRLVAALRQSEPTEAVDAPPALRRTTVLMADGPQDVAVNDAESPLAWLYRRSGRGGLPFIDAAAFAAGERFRSDFTLAGMLPRVTADWSTAVQAGGWNGALLLPGEAAVAARQRVHQALDAVGQELSGVIIDLCGFLKGLEQIERERGWPQRSAKVVVRLALDALARHYGLSAAASGAPSNGRMRHWGAEGYRPTLP